MSLIIAGTGHRPPKLGGYSFEVSSRLETLATSALSRLAPSLVISGMALGWDQALARAAHSLSIPFHAYIPFPGQERMWPRPSQQDYHLLLEKASLTRDCSAGISLSVGAAMQHRNICMVDACSLLLALWDGSPGGTSNCLTYARSISRPIENLWPTWSSQ